MTREEEMWGCEYSFISLVGCGAQAGIALDICEKLHVEVVSIFDGHALQSEVGNKKFGYTIKPFDSIAHEDTGEAILVCDANSARKQYLFHDLQARGYKMATIIHPSVNLAMGFQCGKGCIINAGVMTDYSATIGDGVMLHLGSIVGHNCTVGSFSVVGAMTVMNGWSSCGERTYLYSNTTLVPGVRVGNDCVIGAGSVVTRDIPENIRAWGSPAKTKNNIDDE